MNQASGTGTTTGRIKSLKDGYGVVLDTIFPLPLVRELGPRPQGHKGNCIMRSVIKLARQCQRFNVLWAIENPEKSLCWVRSQLQEHSKMNNVLGNTTKYAYIVEADETMRIRMEGSQGKNHEDHIAGKGMNLLSHYNLVHKIVRVPEAMKMPDAKATVDKGWENLETYHAARNLFERFRGFLELISRFEFEFCRRGIFF